MDVIVIVVGVVVVFDDQIKILIIVFVPTFPPPVEKKKEKKITHVALFYRFLVVIGGEMSCVLFFLYVGRLLAKRSSRGRLRSRRRLSKRYHPQR